MTSLDWNFKVKLTEPVFLIIYASTQVFFGHSYFANDNSMCSTSQILTTCPAYLSLRDLPVNFK